MAFSTTSTVPFAMKVVVVDDWWLLGDSWTWIMEKTSTSLGSLNERCVVSDLNLARQAFQSSSLIKKATLSRP